MSTCINCQLEVTSSYCPACGQRNPIKKINAVNMWNDFLSRVYGFDGMFPRTLMDLTIRPGHAAREYIKGNRVKYYGPVGYLFLMITVYLLLASLLGVDLLEFMKASNPVTIQQDQSQQEFNRMFAGWINDNMRLATFFIATLSVLFTWLYFKKSGYNLIESSVLIFYVYGHQLWLSIVSVILFKFTGVAINFSYQIIISIGYLLFAFANFYAYQAKWKIVLKAFLSYISAYLLMILLGTLVLYYLISTDRELQEKLMPKKNKPTVEQSPSK